MSKATWKYQINGQEHGPIDTKQLQHLAKTGKLKPTDLIWREGLKDWVPASKAKGLFPAGGGPPAEAPTASIDSRESAKDAKPSSPSSGHKSSGLRGKLKTAMAAGKNEWSLSQLKIEKDRLVKETAELEQKCGSHAISDGVTFDDSSINSLAQHGCELLRSLKSKKARQRQLTEEHEDIDESLEEAKTERLQSEIESLDEAIESGTETLQESQKRLGHAILAGSSDSDDGSFASYFGRKLEIDERMREISRQMAELQENREALKTSLGFDIKKVGLAAVAILIIAGIALAVWLSGGGASNMTVEEFKAKIGWQGVASHEKDEFYQLVGKPDKIQEVGDSVYLYYQCSGGRLQLVCNKAVYEYGNTILVTTINRW